MKGVTGNQAQSLNRINGDHCSSSQNLSEINLPKNLSKAVSLEQVSQNIDRMQSHTADYSLAGRLLKTASRFLKKSGAGAVIGSAVASPAGPIAAALGGMLGAFVLSIGSSLLAYCLASIRSDVENQ